jgi:hypothetical protein
MAVEINDPSVIGSWKEIVLYRDDKRKISLCCSTFWQGLVKIRGCFNLRISNKIENGQNILLWADDFTFQELYKPIFELVGFPNRILVQILGNINRFLKFKQSMFSFSVTTKLQKSL